MEHFVIITNESKDKNLDTAKSIKTYLEARFCTCKIAKDYGVDPTREYTTDIEEIPEDTDCILVLGGDGTLLQAANDVNQLGVPILGINLGTLGFLADIEKEQIRNALNDVIANRFEVEERMLLECNYYDSYGDIVKNNALNDVVINKGRYYHLVNVKVYINNELLDQYTGDGVIVSSPTGSTGYNLSAGGPVMLPTMEGIIITPISPHSLNNRSLVVSGEDEVVLEFMSSSNTHEDEGILVVDGVVQKTMNHGERIHIRMAEEKTKLIKVGDMSFFELFHEKLGV